MSRANRITFVWLKKSVEDEQGLTGICYREVKRILSKGKQGVYCLITNCASEVRSQAKEISL